MSDEDSAEPEHGPPRWARTLLAWAEEERKCRTSPSS